MIVMIIRRWLGGLMTLWVLMVFGGVAALGQGGDDLNALDREVLTLFGQGRYAETAVVAKRLIGLAESKVGPEHPFVATSLFNLAQAYRLLGRYAEAEPLYKRSLQIYEKALGPAHPYVAGPLQNLATMYQMAGRADEAEPLHMRALAIREKALGPDHPDVGMSLNDLATLYAGQGRIPEAEALQKRALGIYERALGPEHPFLATSLDNLSHIYRGQGRDSEAEALLKRALAIRDKTLGPDHPDVGMSLNNLAVMYESQGRYVDAEPLYQRALVVYEKGLGLDHPLVGAALNNLAALYEIQGRYTEAEPLHKRALSIREKLLGPDHPDVAMSLNNLGEVFRHLGRNAEAEALYIRALRIYEQTLAPDHPFVGLTLNNLALLYGRIGRHADAETFYKRALHIYETSLDPDQLDTVFSLNNLASLYLSQRDWVRATEYFRRSSGVLMRRAARGAGGGETLTSRGNAETQRLSYPFRGMIKSAHQLSTENGANRELLAREMFQAAQWVQSSEAAGSIAQMAARGAKGDPGLAGSVRERQDLVAEWKKRDSARTAAVSQAPDKRDHAVEAVNGTRLAVINARISEIDADLKVRFPDYAALARPEPLKVDEVQAQLRADEALIMILDTQAWNPVPEETFIWVVTKTDVRWVRSELGTPTLAREVAALRCGLDAASWEGDGAAKCVGLLKIAPEKARHNPLLPFNLTRAHALYEALFGQVEDLIREKHLLLVPSGPLTAFPFQALVTANPTNAASTADADYASASWLIERHATTVLPSVASLKSLRQFAKTSKATRPFIGFGNPLLVGPNGDDKRAWEQQTCKSSSAPVRMVSRRVRAAIPKFFRSGLANVEEVRAQYPLPETADELCAVAQSTGAGQEAVYLGEKASEKAIKALSANGTLAGARVVHFATHGLLAGETEMFAATKAEPALIFSPPDQATEEDDGLLTASEITQLKLDADWVVLSACNTAAGGSDKQGAEALSGLAQAFFYAGARAMLVSHWAVNSDATVKLITRVFDEMKADPKIGRSEALRLSMLALVATGGSDAHPANWAPFVVVGEGSAPQ
jgi:CHAT domain-containing protein/tetratricopeptide (TPR) repeat protein